MKKYIFGISILLILSMSVFVSAETFTESGTYTVSDRYSITHDIKDINYISLNGFYGSIQIESYEGNPVVDISAGGVGYYIREGESKKLRANKVSIESLIEVKVNSIDINNKKASITITEIPSHEIICTDSDGGIDYYTSGEVCVTDAYSCKQDICWNDGKNLTEQFCKWSDIANAEIKDIKVYECPNGCQDGACLERPLIEPNETNRIIEVPNEIINNYDCNGCKDNDKCYFFGYRKAGSYCDDNSSAFITQKTPNSICNNNFECSSNVCVSSQCVSEGLIQRILNWFRRLFGGE